MLEPATSRMARRQRHYRRGQNRSAREGNEERGYGGKKKPTEPVGIPRDMGPLWIVIRPQRAGGTAQ